MGRNAVPSFIYRANDNLLKASRLSTVDTSGQTIYLDGTATVEVTLTDLQGVALAGETWPLPLDYITGSQGDFQGVIRDTVVLPSPGSTVRALLVIDNGIDQHGELTGTLLVQERTW